MWSSVNSWVRKLYFGIGAGLYLGWQSRRECESYARAGDSSIGISATQCLPIVYVVRSRTSPNVHPQTPFPQAISICVSTEMVRITLEFLKVPPKQLVA